MTHKKANYGDARYWDDKYNEQQATTFDWLEGWDDVRTTLEKYAIDGLYEVDQQNPVVIKGGN